MQALTERFELRLPQETLHEIDAWRSKQDGMPSRAEAIRRLVETGLGVSERQPIRFSRGETLIIHMLCELFKNQKVKSEIDPKFVQAALLGGHNWGLEWQYSGTFHNHTDDRSNVTEVVDILDMWDFLEGAYAKLTKVDKDRIAKEADPFGKDVYFSGFDGNNESEHMSIAGFLINDMGRFARFKKRGLNSHMPSIEIYRRMLAVFLPLRSTLAGGELSATQIIQILKARLHPSRR